MKFDTQIFKPFIDGTLKTLKIQCEIEASAGKPYFKGEAEPQNKLNIAIAGIIGLTSKEFSGSIAICYPKEIFLKIMGNMMGEEITTITKDLEDGAAELLNIIFGQAKITLNEQLGYSIEMAIPSVITGTDISTNPMSKGKTIVLPFDIKDGDGGFQIEITLESPKS